MVEKPSIQDHPRSVRCQSVSAILAQQQQQQPHMLSAGQLPLFWPFCGCGTAMIMVVVVVAAIEE